MVVSIGYFGSLFTILFFAFLIHAAANLARAFSAVHDHGHVIGDVNQSNIRVASETAMVSLIDCDSFQISANGKVFPCEVGGIKAWRGRTSL